MCEWNTQVEKIKEIVILRGFIDVLLTSDLIIEKGAFIFAVNFRVSA
jgi:hypothetical protein